MQLTPHVHLVGSGASGVGTTHPFDCHVYAIDGRSEVALIDTGCGEDAEAIVDGLRSAGLADRVRYLLLTHAHPDHSGGAAALQAALPHPDLEVVASPQVATWVETADEAAMSLEIGKRAEFYPADFRFTPCAVNRRVSDGDRIAVGDLELEVIDTPGHADGHLAFVGHASDRRLLFSGDVVFYGGLISLANNWDCRIQQYASTIGRLAGVATDALFPGHHQMSVRDGRCHIDTANRLFTRGFVPRSVV